LFFKDNLSTLSTLKWEKEYKKTAKKKTKQEFPYISEKKEKEKQRKGIPSNLKKGTKENKTSSYYVNIQSL